MDSLVNKYIYEVIFRVKSSRDNEFEKHCKDTSSYLDGHQGYVSSSFSKRLTDDKDFSHYRCEMVFNNKASIDNYLKDIVPKIQQSSKDFGDDAKVEDRRTYRIFHNK